MGGCAWEAALYTACTTASTLPYTVASAVAPRPAVASEQRVCMAGCEWRAAIKVRMEGCAWKGVRGRACTAFCAEHRRSKACSREGAKSGASAEFEEAAALAEERGALRPGGCPPDQHLRHRLRRGPEHHAVRVLVARRGVCAEGRSGPAVVRREAPTRWRDGECRPPLLAQAGQRTAAHPSAPKQHCRRARPACGGPLRAR